MKHLDELVRAIDSHMAQIDGYPNSPRLYLEIYYLLDPHILPKTQKHFFSTFLRKKIVRNLVGRYRIEFQKGLFRNNVFVDYMETPRRGVWVSIPIMPPDGKSYYGRYEVLENGKRRFLHKAEI